MATIEQVRTALVEVDEQDISVLSRSVGVIIEDNSTFRAASVVVVDGPIGTYIGPYPFTGTPSDGDAVQFSTDHWAPVGVTPVSLSPDASAADILNALVTLGFVTVVAPS